MGQRFRLLLEGCLPALAELCHFWVDRLGWRWWLGLSTDPGLQDQFAMADSAPGTLRCAWRLPDHWGQTRRDRQRQLSGPKASHTEGLPSRAWGRV